MTDITNTDLAAALLDQKVAGLMGNRRYAYVAVYQDAGWRLGLAVENEAGYNPIEGKEFATQKEAEFFADSMNEHLGLSRDEAVHIQVTTMRGSRRIN